MIAANTQTNRTYTFETQEQYYDARTRLERDTCFARLSASDGPAKCIDLSMAGAYVAPTQESEYPASQPVRRQ